MKKISIITGGRAEYDLLKPLIEIYHHDSCYHMQLVVTGMHLSPEFGLTIKTIEENQLPISDKVEMLLSTDTSSGISKSVGVGVISFSDALRRLQPDMMIVLGDRFETLSAVIPAFLMKIPVIHLHGGELTEGAFDEGIRHSITKMSHLHFTSTEIYKQRVIQLGEEPDRVFNVGALGVENLKKIKILPKNELEDILGFRFLKRNILVTYHPATLEKENAKNSFENLLRVLNQYKTTGILFTQANADPEGRIINEMIDKFVTDNSINSKSFKMMGQLKYFNAMRYVDAVVGNSSSGIIEAPSLRVGTINLGERQSGRIQAESVINCSTLSDEIEKAFTTVFSNSFQTKLNQVINPYDGGETSKVIHEKIHNYLFEPGCLKKKFYDVGIKNGNT